MHEKRVRKGLKLSILSCLMVFIMVMTAFASALDVSGYTTYPGIDQNAEGSITVNMNTKSDGTGDPVGGGEMTIYKVADVEMNQTIGGYSYILKDSYKGTSYDFEEKLEGKTGTDAGIDWPQLSQYFAEYVDKNGIEGDDTKEISADGTVTFDDEIHAGLYLLVQTTPADGYYAATPFLVSMPTYTEDSGYPEYSYKIDASPKTQVAPLPEKHVYTNGDTTRTDDDDDKGIYVGETLTYTISYTNTRSESATVTVTDLLTKGLEYVSSEPEVTSISTDADGQTELIWVLEDVEAYESGEVKFTAIVTEDAEKIDEITNTGKVKVGEDRSVEVDTNTTHNKLRHYFDIDEEIVVDPGDGDIGDIFHYEDGGWVKDESVTEYYDIEMEMTTLLPVIEVEDLTNGEFSMNFHEFLDDELVLDHSTVSFKIYIRGNDAEDDPGSVLDLDTITKEDGSSYYTIEFPDYECTYPGEEPVQCAFHVYVDLTGLYNDEYISEEDLQGNTWITIFFHGDLEEAYYGEELSGSYSSTVWYEVYDGDTLEHTSNQSVVTVYTYEIALIKYDTSQLVNDDYAAAALAGATLGIYTDPECTNPIMRKDEEYTVTSGENGRAAFYGLAGGTYYIKEIEAPSGYSLSSEVLAVNFSALGSDVYVYEGTFANSRSSTTSGGGHHSTGGGGGGGSGSGSGGPSGGSSGEGDPGGTVWDLLPLPQTGQGWALMIAVCAMLIAGIGLIVAYAVRRKG